MAKMVKVASLLFESGYCQGQPDIREKVLAELRRNMQRLAHAGLDLLVLSESVESDGMSMDMAESLDKPGEFLKLYLDFARAEKCHVAGSLKLKESGRIYNAIVFIDDRGVPAGIYRKTFLTAGEIDQGMSPGKGATIVETKIGRLGGVICFDLNFRELCAEYAKLRPDIMVFASSYHGSFAQSEWAFTCRSFFVSALPFHGGGIIDPLGTPLCVTDCYHNVAVAEINLDRVIVHLDYNRDKFDAIERKYGSNVRIQIPPNLGPAIIYSNSKSRSATDIAREFKLELLDDYLERLRIANKKQRRD